tara:strand:+ start:779 stop:1072 length:294 start_codon:yes stop_codon:yes gene_type:complete
MLIKLIEIYNKKTYTSTSNGKAEEFSLREVFVNPEHVVCMRENDALKNKLSEAEIGKEIHPAEGFTKLYINRGQSGIDLDVVGDVSVIQSKLLGRRG